MAERIKITEREPDPGQRWKCGDEFLPFHPSASHVPPDYRDGWNRCYWMAVTRGAAVARQSELPLTIRQDPDSGWWIITGPPESGLCIANPSLDVCVNDILPSWRAMARLSPEQVPPVPDLGAKGGGDAL